MKQRMSKFYVYFWKMLALIGIYVSVTQKYGLTSKWDTFQDSFKEILAKKGWPRARCVYLDI